MGVKSLYAKVHREASAAGEKAGRECNASKMIVVQRENPLDDSSPIVQAWDNGGKGFEPCGFAWVVMPGNSGFGRWLVKRGYGRKHYGGGVGPWVSMFGQSHERKVAYASAYAKHVNDSGILGEGRRAYAEGRLD